MCTWLKFRSPVLDRIFGLWFLRVLKVTPYHPCFTAPCLTHSCLRTSLHRFLHLHLVRLPLLRCEILRCVHPLPLRKEGFALADWLNNPVTQVMSPNLSSKSAANTPINVPSRKGSLDTNLDDLATTVDASEIHDTTDVGRLTSPLFSQERELSAIPFSVSCSQTHSSVEKSSRR